jgi:hypothetical protein
MEGPVLMALLLSGEFSWKSASLIYLCEIYPRAEPLFEPG